MREIRSADNPRLKRAIRLRDSARERRASGLAYLDGIHLVSTYMDRVGMPREAFVAQSSLGDPEIAGVLAKLGDSALVLADGLFAKLSSVDSPTGVAAIIETARAAPPASPAACVLLDRIQDPGNVGSILRSSAAAGVSEVYLSSGCADAWSPRVLRAAMGAHFTLRLYEDADLVALAKRFEGRVLAAAAEAPTPVFDVDLRGAVAFAFGNEGAGLTQALREATDAAVSVPICAATESLNVAAAAAVCLFERVRQVRRDDLENRDEVKVTR